MQDVPPTEIQTLEKAYKMAKEADMKYVYVGNVPHTDGENTRCPECGELLIERDGFQVVDEKLEKTRKCPSCGTEIDIVT